jgi:hypothetical protein
VAPNYSSGCSPGQPDVARMLHVGLPEGRKPSVFCWPMAAEKARPLGPDFRQS